MDNPNAFPEIIAATLYKYNSIDNKLFTLLMDNCKYKKHKGTYIIKSSDVGEVLKSNFKDKLEKLEILPDASLHKSADSIYFLNKILTEMKNLRWFQFTLDKNATYNRLSFDEEGNKTIDFDFKVIRGSFRTFDIFEQNEIKHVNHVLREVRCITDLQYSLVKLNSLVRRLESLSDLSKNKNVINVCDRLIYHFKSWNKDNPQALIVTDFLDI